LEKSKLLQKRLGIVWEKLKSLKRREVWQVGNRVGLKGRWGKRLRKVYLKEASGGKNLAAYEANIYLKNQRRGRRGPLTKLH